MRIESEYFYEQYLQLRGGAQRSRANAKLRVKIGTFSPCDIYYFFSNHQKMLKIFFSNHQKMLTFLSK